jgi:hypothetical protein
MGEFIKEIEELPDYFPEEWLVPLPEEETVPA